jgi:hypothetical protein
MLDMNQARAEVGVAAAAGIKAGAAGDGRAAIVVLEAAPI